MPVTFADGVATLTAVVCVEDAEPLTRWLRETADPGVDLTGCTHLHTAALQALMAARPRVLGVAGDPFLARWVAPLLTTTQEIP